MPSSNQFTALGPAAVGFQTHGTQIDKGADITGNKFGVRGYSDNGIGVEAGSKTNAGVAGISFTGPNAGQVFENTIENGTFPGVGLLGLGEFGVLAFGVKSGVLGQSVFATPDSPEGSGGCGVVGVSAHNNGVAGFFFHADDPNYEQPLNAPQSLHNGVFGSTTWSDGAGIAGQSNAGVGVRGESTANDAIVGQSGGTDKGGVVGLNSSKSGAGFGVLGRSISSRGIAVAGINTSAGIAVSGISEHGYGAELLGGRAPLRLSPSTTAGPPTSGDHLMGELYVDSGGNLFFCKSSGTPGNWVQLA